jgi:hypothetical protein
MSYSCHLDTLLSRHLDVVLLCHLDHVLSSPSYVLPSYSLYLNLLHSFNLSLLSF